MRRSAGRQPTSFDLSRSANAPQVKRIFVAAIIGSALGIANIDEILAVEGADAAIVSPSDLTADLGQIGNFSSPVYAQALARVERAAVEHRKLVGVPRHEGQSIDDLRKRGHRIFIVGSDVSLMREAMSLRLTEARTA